MKNTEYERKYTFKPPRSCKVSDMIYPDRCMMKWQGYLLSDHNEAMEEEKGYEDMVISVSRKDPQEYERWNEILLYSLMEKAPVSFEYVDEEHNVKYFKGYVRRYTRDSLILKNDERDLCINKNLILNIQR